MWSTAEWRAQREWNGDFVAVRRGRIPPSNDANQSGIALEHSHMSELLCTTTLVSLIFLYPEAGYQD